MSSSTEPSWTDRGTIETYRFTPDDLRPDARTPGISAFMRIKNGADFLEATIRSHINHVDEIVAVHNQCTDATPEILARLKAEFGPKLRVVHYLPKVHPPGSAGHAREPADSPASFVNMSNLALASTRHRIAMKLDDDHLAMPERLAGLVARVRAATYRLPDTLCFSGINLARDASGQFGVLAAEPFAGAGDHYFVEVTPATFFVHDPRFEDFRHRGRRIFGDITYWHLKYLKPGFGFANRDIEAGGNPRFERKRTEFLAGRRVVPLAALRKRMPAWTALPLWLMPEKMRLKASRWRRFVEAGPGDEAMAAVLGTN